MSFKFDQLPRFANAYKSTVGQRWTPELNKRFFDAIADHGLDPTMIHSESLPDIQKARLSTKIRRELRLDSPEFAEALGKHRQKTSIVNRMIENKIDKKLANGPLDCETDNQPENPNDAVPLSPVSADGPMPDFEREFGIN